MIELKCIRKKCHRCVDVRLDIFQEDTENEYHEQKEHENNRNETHSRSNKRTEQRAYCTFHFRITKRIFTDAQRRRYFSNKALASRATIMRSSWFLYSLMLGISAMDLKRGLIPRPLTIFLQVGKQDVLKEDKYITFIKGLGNNEKNS